MRNEIQNPYIDIEAGRQLVVSPELGKLKGAGEIVPEEREDEPIIGAAAREFTQEALLHPERYEYIAQYVKTLADHFGLESPMIMDFGSGPSILTSMIAKLIPRANVLGIDLSQDMLDLAAQTIVQFDVHDRVQLYKQDVRDVFKSAPEPADIVVSRNMLHRLTSLEEGLMRMTRVAKSEGGMIFNTSFRRVSDLDKDGQLKFVQAVQERNDFPSLQEAYVLAYLNAPTLEEYEKAARRVAHSVDAEDMWVQPGENNEVNVYIRKKR